MFSGEFPGADNDGDSGASSEPRICGSRLISIKSGASEKRFGSVVGSVAGAGALGATGPMEDAAGGAVESNG